MCRGGKGGGWGGWVGGELKAKGGAEKRRRVKQWSAWVQCVSGLKQRSAPFSEGMQVSVGLNVI